MERSSVTASLGPPREDLSQVSFRLQPARNRLGSFLRLVHRLPVAQPENPEPLLLSMFPNTGRRLLKAGGHRRWIFVDLETCGLQRETALPFLIGLARWTDRGLECEQFLARDFADEPAILLETASRLARFRVLVTYNGRHFDWPILQARHRLLRAGDLPAPPLHLDLLPAARALWRAQIGSARLVAIERGILGLVRHGDIPGSMVAPLYHQFLREGDLNCLTPVIRHNRDDLLGLACLTVHLCQILEAPTGNQYRELLQRRTKPNGT
jgi:uncharacterized protein YprB with RNaseH-like and TPR domain